MSDERATPVLFGWFDHRATLTDRTGDVAAVQDPAGDSIVNGPGFFIRVQSAHAAFHVGDGTVTAVIGAPRDQTMSTLSTSDTARIVIDANWDRLRGRFAIVHLDLRQGRATLVTDRFAVLPLCWSIDEARIVFSDRADAVRPPADREIDAQALFNYAYFHVIPAPRTIFRGVQRLEPAECLTFDASGVQSRATWRPGSVVGAPFNFETAQQQFRQLLRRAVEREAATPRTGAFLSGGTDSSTVVGLLTQLGGAPVDCFSIGFDASGYDEMTYARIAARHFNCKHHEHYVTPAELIRAIPRVAGHFDQPFGNSSALPAYYCAALARQHGIDKMLAGDGGDELFGGNTRYARQKVFGVYAALPSMIRRRLEAALLESRFAARLPGIRKLARYVEQARVPMPDRMETYNLLDRFGFVKVFTPFFLDGLDAEEPRALQREIYQRGRMSSLIDCMLAYDWRFTLADSDLPKVRLAAQLAGETVGFPLLDDELVDFSLTLPSSMKVRGLSLRYFFKRALRGFLPPEIIRKKKHGFGLPFGPWLLRDKALARFAEDSLQSLAERRVIRRELAHDLFSVRLAEHPGFYGEMAWILMMLEHWLQRHAPAYRPG